MDYIRNVIEVRQTEIFAAGWQICAMVARGPTLTPVFVDFRSAMLATQSQLAAEYRK